MHAILSDPQAMRYWSTLPHAEQSQTDAWLASMIDAPLATSDDFILERAGEVIGKLGAWRLPDIGYLLSPSVWGQGYASEALAAFIAHRRRQSGGDLTADTDPRNVASNRLLAKHGFVETGRASRTWLVGDEYCDSIYWRLKL